MVLHEVHIKFHGNSKGITGNGRIIYDKLKVLILKPNSKSPKTKKQKFVSFFANIFAVRAHNRIGKKEVLAKTYILLGSADNHLETSSGNYFLKASKK